jgi:branched-chain amino acid transport system substrate-binding protein
MLRTDRLGASYRAHIRWAAVLSAAALGAAACSGSSGGSSGGSAVGVTSTTVRIGSTQPLTGIAAPGYSEIAPASAAMFSYINAHGGVNGRKIVYKYVDDQYTPSKTVAQTRKLLQQDKVFAIFNALGTRTHEKVAGTLNAQKVPDLFVGSGCVCWDDVSARPYTFGWQTDYTVEGKILGNYVAQHFKGKKVAYYYQDDDFGRDGVKGLDMEIPKSQVVARVPYELTSTDEAPLVQRLQRSKADVVVAFSIPAFTALLKLNMVAVSYAPTLVVSNVGADPITLSGLLKEFTRQRHHTITSAQGNGLIQGIISDASLPTTADVSNSWVELFKKVHDQYDAKAPFDGNVEYGMAAAVAFAEALKAAGKHPTRDGIVKAIEHGIPQGPGLVPYRYSSSSHAGFTGAQIGVITGQALKLQGQPMTTDDGTGPITPYTGGQQPPPANAVP